MTDVIVVGAGPSGSMTALLLARAGFKVLVIDRSTFPRAKPCGDCLSAESTRLLERHQLLDSVLAAPHARLRGWRIFAPSGHHFAADFEDSGALAVERFVFDDILVRAAVDAGAELMERARCTDVVIESGRVTGVRVSTAGEELVLNARHVIGADGLRSVTARKLGALRPPRAGSRRVRKVSLTTHVDGRLAFDDYGEMHIGDGICVGVAPVRLDMNRWNITVVASSERFGRAVAQDAGAFFGQALSSLPGTRGRVREFALATALRESLASGPFDVPTKQIAFEGATLTGDAAGYFDPFTGQGVYHALRSAELLVDVLTGELRHTDEASGTRLEDYERASAAFDRGPRRLQKVIDRVLSNPALADRAIARIARAPEAARALLNVTGDVAPVRSLFSKAVARSILFPGSTSR